MITDGVGTVSLRRRSLPADPESYRGAAKRFSHREHPARVVLPCDCQCHTGAHAAHVGQRCRCNGGEGYLAPGASLPAKQPKPKPGCDCWCHTVGGAHPGLKCVCNGGTGYALSRADGRSERVGGVPAAPVAHPDNQLDYEQPDRDPEQPEQRVDSEAEPAKQQDQQQDHYK